MGTPVEARAEVVDQPFSRELFANSAGEGLSLLQVGCFGFEPNHIRIRRKSQRSGYSGINSAGSMVVSLAGPRNYVKN